MSRFIVHKHTARNLHWDLRLEIKGMLKSWALPKEPPKVRKIKRLAIQVEDHSLSYLDFKGQIPEGFYGAGKVEIWDKGTYKLEKKRNDELLFTLQGKKLKGSYCLIKFKNLKNKRNWLFFKR
jgi:DNA ligase D-like protein (predicted 3'-phosphoesterase)